MSSKKKQDSSPKSSVNSGQKLPNDVLGVIGTKANAKTKAALKATTKFLKNEVTVVRPPRIIDYSASNSNSSVSPRLLLEKYKNTDTIEGDLIHDSNRYNNTGIYFFTVSKSGEKNLNYPEYDGDGEASVPKWVMKKGLENGHSLKTLIKIYSKGSFRFAKIPNENIPKKIKNKIKENEMYVYDFDDKKFTVVGNN